MFSISFNGQPEGFFPGQKGVKAGRPSIPLFVFVGYGSSHCSSTIQGDSSNFQFSSQALHLTHLIFVDDLFVLCEVEVNSFSIIAEVLHDFHLFSGLKPNLLKSSIFVCWS